MQENSMICFLYIKHLTCFKALCRSILIISPKHIVIVKGLAMAIAVAFLLLLVASPTVYAVNYIVGDSSGWSQGVDYSTWAQGKTFNVGDTLCKFQIKHVSHI
ncbi:hypothetical protein SLEP1_g23839 [Rubroshorea leprosula]|uniref:Phytocyanin domain-containing protein n=1 Tax=Rubroshorea leprosula TaxID=152421 RepID=A0AAV5JMD5_9ROSI|nr:hypothetical protein SLEP1_g23839 [Rubroshorea leprosula]